MDMQSYLGFLGILCIRGSKLRSRVLYNGNRSKPDSSVISIFDDELEGLTKTTSPSRHAVLAAIFLFFFFAWTNQFASPGTLEELTIVPLRRLVREDIDS